MGSVSFLEQGSISQTWPLRLICWALSITVECYNISWYICGCGFLVASKASKKDNLLFFWILERSNIERLRRSTIRSIRLLSSNGLIPCKWTWRRIITLRHALSLYQDTNDHCVKQISHLSEAVVVYSLPVIKVVYECVKK